jgi:hypothetical protein
MGQGLPQTAAGTAVAYGHKFSGRPQIKPDSINSVAAYHVNQTGLPAPSGMFNCLICSGPPAETGVDAPCSLSQKNAAIFNRIILASCRIPADAKIHYPDK